MKKLRNLVPIMAAMAMATVFTGCGDDDDDDDDDNGQPQGPVIVAPADEAALTAQGNVYTVNVANQAEPLELRFPAAGQYRIAQGATVETGTISGATRADNTWTMTVTPDAGQPDAQAGVLRLDFTAGNAGAWTFTPAGGQAESGTFTLTTDGGNTDGGNTDGGNTDGGNTDGGNTDGGNTDGGNTNGGNTGEPTTADLSGRTLQLTYGGFGEKFTFTSPTTAVYEDTEQGAIYSYDPGTRRLNATRAGGQTYEITLVPDGDNTAPNGNATVVYRDNPNSTPTTDPATYTWQ